MMRIPSAVAVAALISGASAVIGQNHVTSPAGYMSHEGAGATVFFGILSDGRFMFLDGELRGTPRLLAAIAARPDYYTHAVHEPIPSMTSMGRSWSNVDLSLSTCDVGRVSATFSSNPTSTPATVFRGRVSWPTLRGALASNPAPWGGTSGGIAFPFTRPWLYLGTADLCADFDFTGGTLANGAPFQSGRRDLRYALDGYPEIDPVSGGWETFGDAGLGRGCVDSAATWGAIVAVGLDAFRAPRRQVEVRTFSQNTAANAPVVHAVGLAGDPAGSVFPGVTCNRLHLAAGAPVLLLPGLADGAGGRLVQWGRVPHRPGLVGAELWAQGAWQDSVSGRLQLTAASAGRVPELWSQVRRVAVWQYQSGKYGMGYVDPGAWANPIFRYTH